MNLARELKMTERVSGIGWIEVMVATVIVMVLSSFLYMIVKLSVYHEVCGSDPLSKRCQGVCSENPWSNECQS